MIIRCYKLPTERKRLPKEHKPLLMLHKFKLRKRPKELPNCRLHTTKKYRLPPREHKPLVIPKEMPLTTKLKKRPKNLSTPNLKLQERKR